MRTMFKAEEMKVIEKKGRKSHTNRRVTWRQNILPALNSNIKLKNGKWKYTSCTSMQSAAFPFKILPRRKFSTNSLSFNLT